MKTFRSTKTRRPTMLSYKIMYYCLTLIFVVLIQVLIINNYYSNLEKLSTSFGIGVDNDIRAHTHRYHATHNTNNTTVGRNGSDFHKTDIGGAGKGLLIDISSLSEDQSAKMDMGYSRHGFNEYVSDLISIRRRTPDFRPTVCRDVSYPDDLPKTSVIICFHNEAWSTLLRTVFSVLDNTPSNLLHEIILVDDYSDHVSLATPLDEYVQKLPKVRLVRASSRLGLIGARLLGTVSSTAPVLTFLDSHVECLAGWLQPMLSRIHDSNYHVVYPILHIIDYNDFSIRQTPIGKRGLFHWMDLSYFPSQAPDYIMDQRTSDNDPIPSPTMPGGIFSISRRYFDLLGRYDPRLRTWGSENTELSFKVWMCNGTIEILPCSGIAHLFRKVNPNLDGDFYTTISTNAMRVAYVWMDQYKYFFFNNFIENGRMPGFGDVSERLSLREKLKCRDFAWYMENVAKDMYAPVRSSHIQEIFSVQFKNICLGHSFHKPEVLTGNCKTLLRHQKVWYLEHSGRLLGQMLYQNQSWSCLSVIDHTLTTEMCDKDAARQQWQYTKEFTLRNVLTNQCVTLTSGTDVKMEYCDSNHSQTWSLTKFPTHTYGA